jgi:hypothetical protein
MLSLDDTVNDNIDVLEAAALGKELSGIPEALLSDAVFLGVDGTIVGTESEDAAAGEDDASSAAAVDASSNRRLKTWGRHNDKDDKHDDDDDDKDECPRGWLNSKRPCDVTGCGTCCVRMIK